MIRATILEDGRLKITADNEGRQELRERFGWAPENFVADELAVNGYLFIDPSDVGALTSSPIIGDAQPGYNPDVWWFPNYQITDPWEELKNTGKVFFEPEENNKSLAEARHAESIRADQDPDLNPFLQPKFAECGSCGAFHRIDYWGDCRNDVERFNELPAGALYQDLEGNIGPY